MHATPPPVSVHPTTPNFNPEALHDRQRLVCPSPRLGQQNGATLIYSDLFRFPRSLPICSDLRFLFSGRPDLFRFPRFLPICSDLRSLFSGRPRFVPISFRFLPICFQDKSEQIRTNRGNPFLSTPFASPRPRVCGKGFLWEEGFFSEGSFSSDFRALKV